MLMMMISDKMRKSNGLTFVRLPTRHTLDKQIEQTSTMMTMMKMMMMMMKMVMMISTMRMMEICQMGFVFAISCLVASTHPNGL